MPQTSVSERMEKGFVGQVAEGGIALFARSASAEGADVSAGMPVKRGTLLQTQAEPFEAGDLPNLANFAGFVILDTSRAYSDDAIEDGDPIAVLRHGSIFLDFAAAVDAGERVALTLASGALNGLAEGVSPASGVVILPGCRIIETTGAAGIAAVEVDLVGKANGQDVLTEAVPPAHVANDVIIPAYPPSGSVYDIATTAAATDVTLPADAHEGTVLHFVADGTKNGHAVTYRDVTVDLTTALTASKRHQVTAIHLNGAWTCVAYVSP